MFKELLLSWKLVVNFLFSKYKGLKYPLTNRHLNGSTYRYRKEVAASEILNVLQFSDLYHFLRTRKEQFVLVASIHNNGLWVTVHQNFIDLIDPPNDFERVYNELWGVDGTFHFTVKDGRLNYAHRKDRTYFNPEAPLMCWKGALSNNVDQHLSSIKENYHA